MHITITGNLGSGKSSVCRMLSENHAFKSYSTGDVQRALAQRMGMTTLELNLYMQQSPEQDKLIDDEVITIAQANAEEDIIFDSRMAWHFVPFSFKVFLQVDLQVAAGRVFEDSKRGNVETYASKEEAAALLQERAASERLRFMQFYGVDYFDLANYNLVVDTSHISVVAVTAIIYQKALELYKHIPFVST